MRRIAPHPPVTFHPGKEPLIKTALDWNVETRAAHLKLRPEHLTGSNASKRQPERAATRGEM